MLTRQTAIISSSILGHVTNENADIAAACWSECEHLLPLNSALTERLSTQFLSLPYTRLASLRPWRLEIGSWTSSQLEGFKCSSM